MASTIGRAWAALLCGILICAMPARAQAPREERTAEAVVRADLAWGDAETRGDVAFVSALLLDNYVSVASNGRATTRAEIIESTRRHGGSPERAALVAAWRAAHPTRSEVTLSGDTAILKWVSTQAGADGTVSSVDVFAYTDGRWRALYSQHSTASD